jgi:hypothetical protein
MKVAGFASLALAVLLALPAAAVPCHLSAPAGLNRGARDLTPAQARDVVAYLVGRGEMTLVGATVGCDASGRVTSPAPNARLRVGPNIAGVRFQSGDTTSTTRFLDGFDVRGAVLAYQVASRLKSQWGANVIYFSGVGHGRGPATDCHHQGRALDFYGASGTHGGHAWDFRVSRNWGHANVPVPESRAHRNVWAARPAGGFRFRLPADAGPTAHNIFASVYETATKHAADTTVRPGANGARTRIGQTSFICHPDHPAAGLRRQHQDHVHMQVGPT